MPIRIFYSWQSDVRVNRNSRARLEPQRARAAKILLRYSVRFNLTQLGHLACRVQTQKKIGPSRQSNFLAALSNAQKVIFTISAGSEVSFSKSIATRLGLQEQSPAPR